MPSAQRSIADSALLIMDMINDFAFPGGRELLVHTRKAMPAMLALRKRYDAKQRPVIYANDNFGRWHSQFSQVVAHCRRKDATGSAVVARMAPRPAHYSVLKPRHSAFFMTPLDLLLQELQVTALTIVGIAGDQCVLNTAMDAHMREYTVWVPSDAVASITAARNQRALDYMHEVIQAHVAPVAG